MQTKVKIEPAYTITKFRVQYFETGRWHNTYPLLESQFEANESLCTHMDEGGYKRKNLRVVTEDVRVPEFPTQDYIEEMWLRGYQIARSGSANAYGPSINHDLIEEGMEAFRNGVKLFA